ncbi:unnamed protein product [Coffea canephora]|uniref:Uncharacterized protein n=1 Tax=Coffea canephora TaxID=49390 RepID=A0A068TU75_COFCA|nr:unnamed protein product [Coffea canephora]
MVSSLSESFLIRTFKFPNFHLPHDCKAVKAYSAQETNEATGSPAPIPCQFSTNFLSHSSSPNHSCSNLRVSLLLLLLLKALTVYLIEMQIGAWSDQEEERCRTIVVGKSERHSGDATALSNLSQIR